MSKKLYTIAALTCLLCGLTSTLQHAQPPAPQPSEKELEEFFTAFFDELAKEIEKEEGKKATPSSPAKPIQPLSPSHEQKKDDPHKTLAQLFEEPITLEKDQKLQDAPLSKRKEEAFEHYMGEFYEAIVQLNHAIAALDLHKKHTVGATDVEIMHNLAADIAQLANPHVPVYRAALFLPDFTKLRRKIIRLTHALNVIGMDITPPKESWTYEDITKVKRPDVARKAPTFVPREKKARRTLEQEAARRREQKQIMSSPQKSSPPQAPSSFMSQVLSYITTPFKKLYALIVGTPTPLPQKTTKHAAHPARPVSSSPTTKSDPGQSQSNLFTQALEHFAQAQSPHASSKIPSRHKQVLWELISLLQGELKTLHGELEAVAQKAQKPLEELREKQTKEEEKARRDAERRERISRAQSRSSYQPPSHGPRFGGSPASRPPQYRQQPGYTGMPYQHARFGRPPVGRMPSSYTPQRIHSTTPARTRQGEEKKDDEKKKDVAAGRASGTNNFVAEQNIKKRVIREVNELDKDPKDTRDRIRKINRLIDELESVELKLPESRTEQKAWQELDASYQNARKKFELLTAQKSLDAPSQEPRNVPASTYRVPETAAPESTPSRVEQPEPSTQPATPHARITDYLSTDQDARLSALKHLLRHMQQAPALNVAPRVRSSIEQFVRMKTWKQARGTGMSNEVWRTNVADVLSRVTQELKDSHFNRWDLVESLANKLQEDDELSPELKQYNSSLRKGHGMRTPPVSVQQYIDPAQQLLTSLAATNQP